MAELKVGVAGATGAVGSEVLKVLDTAPWRPDEVVALASPATTIPFVAYGDQQIAVDDLAHQVLDELDLLILAIPGEAARQYGGQAMDDGVLTVDCSGVFSSDADVPLLVPWVNPEQLQTAIESGAATMPSAASLLISSIVGPLNRAGLGGEYEATVMLPASHWGRNGISELSKQVVTLFNSGTPPRKVFGQWLAFDLIPQLGAADTAGKTEVEERIFQEVGRLVGLAPSWVTAIAVPVFSGISAHITLRPPRRVPADLVSQILKDGGVVIADDQSQRAVARPRSVEGHPFAHAGRIRIDERGAVHIWASMDNLRATAAAAVACGGALVKQIRG